MIGPRVPVLYLDIDGTVRWSVDELGHYVGGPEDVHVYPEVPNLLYRYRAAGWRIVGVSNQGGVAKGRVTWERVQAAMAETQRQCGGLFDSIAACPHHPDAIDPADRACWCRKPRPGLVIEAALAMAQRHPGETYPPALGLMVGDRPEDEGCAEAAGLQFMPASQWRAGRHDL